MNSRQICIAQAILKHANGIAGADEIAYMLGYRPRESGRLAVSSSLRAMMNAGIVGRIPPRDQWDHADYFITREAKTKIRKWEYWL